MMQRPEILTPQRQQAVQEFCRRWSVREFSLFGSAIRSDFTDASDIDVLVSLDPEAHRTLFDLPAMRRELMDIFGRDVDLHTRGGVEASLNPVRRQTILSSAQRIYAA